MKTWKLTFPRRRCPKCGTTVYATFTGYYRVRVLRAEREPTEGEGSQEPQDVVRVVKR